MMDDEKWLRSLKTRAEHTVYACQHEFAQEFSEHDRSCPVYITAECTVALAGYTPATFMVAWAAGTVHHA